MKRFLFSVMFAAIFLFSACGEKEGTVLNFLYADGEGPFVAELYGADGLSVGTVKLEKGKNSLSSLPPCYLQFTPPSGYDCPVAFVGGDLTVKVLPAEYSEEENCYLYVYTVFLPHADPEKSCRLQICKTEGGEIGYCKTAPFEGGKAELALAEGDYLCEVFEEGELVFSRPFAFAYNSVRFCVAETEAEDEK